MFSRLPSGLTFGGSAEPSDGVAVCAAAMRKKPLLGLYMGRIHTARDTVLQEENIAFLADGARKLVSLLD